MCDRKSRKRLRNGCLDIKHNDFGTNKLGVPK